jgi:hypothetical protein
MTLESVQRFFLIRYGGVIMRRIILFFSLLFVSGTIAPTVFAADFDGSKPLLCSVIKVFECSPTEGCKEYSAEEENIPQFLKIDFNEKKLTSPLGGEPMRTSEIERMEQIDGKLMLQGAEDGIENVKDGLAWSIAIEEDTGKMVLTASGDAVGFVVFGACLAQ